MTTDVSTPPRLLQSVSRSHPGRRRGRNEDRVLACPELGLWAVADGMGGHRDGGAAAERLLAALETEPDPRAVSGFARLTELESRAVQVNAELHAERAEHGGASGATLVALLVHEAHAACIWAGDSRAYLLRDGRLARISRDHSLVQELVDAGALSEGARVRHPEANVVTRAVGAGPVLELERRFLPVAPGDVFLLCSDGLTGCLDDGAIADLLRGDGAPLEASADALLEAALAAGAPDNVSLVLVATPA